MLEGKYIWTEKGSREIGDAKHVLVQGQIIDAQLVYLSYRFVQFWKILISPGCFVDEYVSTHIRKRVVHINSKL